MAGKLTPAQERRARQLLELYKQGGSADPLANALLGVGDAAHRVTKATHTQRPARAVARALERPGYVALKTAETLHKVNTDLGTSLRETVPGAIVAGKAVALDTRDMYRARQHDRNASLLDQFPRTKRLGKAVAKSVRSDFQHPLRHPGYTLLDVLTVAAGGQAAASKFGAAGRAFDEAALAAGKPRLPASYGWYRPVERGRSVNRAPKLEAAPLSPRVAAVKAAIVSRPPATLPAAAALRYSRVGRVAEPLAASSEPETTRRRLPQAARKRQPFGGPR
jgi:hypothetical protein